MASAANTNMVNASAAAKLVIVETRSQACRTAASGSAMAKIEPASRVGARRGRECGPVRSEPPED